MAVEVELVLRSKEGQPKKRVNSELMSLCNLQCHYEDEDMPEEDKNMTDNEDVSPGYS